MSRNFISRAKHFVNDYLSRGGIHGFTYLGDLSTLHIVEKIFWLILICVGVFFSVDFGLESWDRYLHKATVVSVERDYYYWNTSMPSLTICPIARLMKTRYDEYAE
jgi:acid-sensing ion channel, other